MNFQEKLERYMEELNCSAKELAEASGLSAAMLSRYRNGRQQPAADSEALEKLVQGMTALADVRRPEGFDRKTVLADLRSVLNAGNTVEFFPEKLNLLIQALHINVANMARSMRYDASFLSKIRTGRRYPSDVSAFVSRLSEFIANNYWDEPSRRILAELIACEPEDLSSRAGIAALLTNWLTSGLLSSDAESSYTNSFLHKLNDFNLNDYIRAIHFDDLKVPTAPFQLPASKVFWGMEGQKKATLDFLKGVVLSKSKEPLFMYADMDIEEMSADQNFSRSWMGGLAMVLKKGQPIHIIHNLNRPFHEMMLGLEAYIPLYMTGLVSPYYFSGVHNSVFRHYLNVSESYALSGESVADSQSVSRFFLTNNKNEVAYYRKRAAHLLKMANPLMDIYTTDDDVQFKKFLDASSREAGERHFISSSLPAFTLPQERLKELLASAQIDAARQDTLIGIVQKQQAAMETLLEQNTVLDELPLVSREEYAQHPLFLTFGDFSHAPIPYSYEDYERHLRFTEEYAAAHPGYQIRLCPDFAFRNIRIDILPGKWVWITKTASPAIHFVIYQRQLREAIENMYIAVFDK